MFSINIDKSSKISITRQLCDQIRNLIIEGKLKSGDKLPPTRRLSQEYEISRNVVIEAYEQLIAEGFLESVIGSGTYVASNIVPIHSKKNSLKSVEETEKRDKAIIDFISGIPDLSLFPKKQWLNCVKEAFNESENLLGYGDIIGDYNLRRSVAQYLFRLRGIKTSSEQVFIFSGASQAYILIGKVLRNYFEKVYIEEPMVRFIPNIFANLGYKLIPTEVDNLGMKVSIFSSNSDKALVLLTPSHQFPTGSILSIQRRQEVLNWAIKNDSLIIEDDYDGEFRYKGVPIPPLWSLDENYVIYVGTFSKSLSPALRLGFAIFPERLVDIFKKGKIDLNMYTPLLDQRILSLFINKGYLERHIYRMNKIYKRKRNILEEELKLVFGDDVKIEGNQAGLHMVVEFILNKEVDWENTENYKVKVYPFKKYSFTNANYHNKLVLGYGNLSFDNIKEGVRRLKKFLSEI